MKFNTISQKGENPSLFKQSLILLTNNDGEEKPPNKAQKIVQSLPISISTALEPYPEFHLLLAFFQESLRSALEYEIVAPRWKKLSPDIRNNVLEALAWVISPETKWFYSLHAISEFLSLDPEFLRRKICTAIGLTRAEIKMLLIKEGWNCQEGQHPRRSKRRIRRKRR